jgi:four helix bundle protein
VASGQLIQAMLSIRSIASIEVEMQIKHYQQLIAWKKAIALVTNVYSVTATFPRDEVYGLTSQLRREAVSIPSNIAEGQGRATKGEFIQFLGHSRGSLFEVETQLAISRNLGYITSEQQTYLSSELSELGRILNGLITSLQQKRDYALATSH